MKEKIDVEPGIYYDVPFEDYLNWNCFSKSMISSLLISPKHYKDYEKNGLKSSGFAFGNALEDYLLEKDKFWETYVFLPETYENKKGEIKPFSLKSPACREIKEAYEMRGFTTIEPSLVSILEDIEIEVKKSHINNLIQGTPQVSVVWRNENTGVLCKARYDILNEENITDLKSTKSAEINSFRKDMYNLKYHCQAGMYQESWAFHNNGEMLPFIFACIENTSPYAIASYAIREDSMTLGLREAERAMRIYQECVESDVWPGFEDQVQDIDIPEYVLKNAYDSGVL